MKDPEAWATVDADRIRRLGPTDLGDGPWGAAASPTTVGRSGGWTSTGQVNALTVQRRFIWIGWPRWSGPVERWTPLADR
ncbi:MAG: hypothetical protein CM1200mP26_28170 [Acidimicrobiales bacterium]|nr:MAG: hypothetical protein CM1200mP26_28170 [Acidimicrobiales bacterium]